MFKNLVLLNNSKRGVFMKTKAFFLVIFIAVLLVVMGCGSGSRVTINLSAGEGVNLNGALVRLTNHDGNELHVYEQVARGNIVNFRNVAQGTYSLRVTHLGITMTGSNNLQIMAKEFLSSETVSYIGGLGPAGGIVFYDKGNNNDGWRFLEAAPADSEFNAQWGAFRHDVAGTQLGIGTGRRNTELIVARLGQLGETGRAAQLCVSLNINGFNDWFLPSRDELNQMFQRRAIIGGFSNYWYWSSSQSNTNSAWNQNFLNGNQNYFNKSQSGRVRAVRAF